MLRKMRAFCVICGLIALGLGCIRGGGVQADEMPSLLPYFNQLQLPAGHAELSNGFDMTANGWGGYGTAVVALSGPLHVDGWRLKLSGGYSSYHYKNPRPIASSPPRRKSNGQAPISVRSAMRLRAIRRKARNAPRLRPSWPPPAWSWKAIKYTR